MTKNNKAAMQSDDHTPETQTNSDGKESRFIKRHGGKRPNSGRPAGSPNKLTRPFKEAAAMESEACLETLVHLRDHGGSEQVRLAAANSLLDRGHGRPSQQIGITQQEPRTFIIDRFGYMRKPGWEPKILPEPETTQPDDSAELLTRKRLP
ncbi:MAG: hypothetical protein H8K03_01155 [Nitrospira sp.]